MSMFTVILLIYLAIGLVVGLSFVIVGVNRVDPVAKGSPFIFRLMILPGSVGLWPVVLKMWLTAGGTQKGGDA